MWNVVGGLCILLALWLGVRFIRELRSSGNFLTSDQRLNIILFLLASALALFTLGPTSPQPPPVIVCADVQPTANDDILIVVGSFNDKSGNAEVRVSVMDRIHKTLSDIKNEYNLSSVSIVKVQTPIIEETDQAKEIMRACNARLLLWGERDSAGATISAVSEDAQLVLASQDMGEIITYDPEITAICLSRETIAQSSYLSFYAIGNSLIVWEDPVALTQALQYINAAIDGIEQRDPQTTCSTFNPWRAYAIKGHIVATQAKHAGEADRHSEAISLRQKAINAYQQSINLNNTQAWVYTSLGYSQAALAELYARDGRTDEAVQMRLAAIDSYTQNAAIDATNASVWFNMGNSQAALAELYARDGRTDEAVQMRLVAIDSYTQATTMDAGFVGAWFNMGASQAALAALYARQGQTDEAVQIYLAAIDSYTQATTIDEGYTSAWFNMGLSQAALVELYAREGRTDEAVQMRLATIDSYTRVHDLDPANLSAIYNRGLVYYELEAWQQTYDDFDKLLQHEPTNYGALLYRGIAGIELGNDEQAERDLRQSLAIALEGNHTWYVDRATKELERMGLEP